MLDLDYKKWFGLKLGVFAIVVGLIWVWRPLFHGIIYRVMYSPGMLFLIGIPLIAGLILFFMPPIERENSVDSSVMSKTYLLTGFVILGLVIALVGGVAGGMLENRTLAEETMSDSQQIDELPDVNEDNPRVVPRTVSDVQASGSVSYSQHRLGPSDIARDTDGSLAWTYAIEPDNFRNQVSNNQRGLLYSDMTKMEDREIRAVDDREFKYGTNMILHRGVEWQLLKSDYMVQYRDDPVEFMHDDDAYMAFTKTGHEWHLTPFPHTTPTWEGVALVHEDGTIEHMSPEEAQESEVLDGQRLYPLYNSQKKAQSLSYREGIINQMPALGQRENVVDPATIPESAENTQPFVIDMEGEQMSYSYAMEPPGSGTGLSEVWFYNAETGEGQYYETGSETIFGPDRAMGIVRSEDSRTGWGDDFVVLEPVPTVVNDDLWWHMKVAPVDYTDITRNVFVNAETGEAVAIFNTQGVIDFMQGEEIDEIEGATDEIENGDDMDEVTAEPSDEEGIAYELVIYDSDGNEIDRIPIEHGQSFDIEVSEEVEEQE